MNEATKVREVTAILNMPAGSSIIYHVGFLTSDRGGAGPKTQLEQAINEVGNIAWKLMEKGSVLLTQRRVGVERFEYIATRAKPRS